MTRDWKNYYLDYYLQHVTGTVHQWQPALLIEPVAEIFYTEYIKMSRRWDIPTLGYVIMPEHFHILITAHSGVRISKFLHGFRRSISGKIRRLIESEANRWHNIFIQNGVETNAFYVKTAGKSEFRFWKEKPHVFAMNFWPDIEEKLNYIHNNPVRRGLVGAPEDWPHSSIRNHMFDDTTRIAIGIRPQDVVRRSPDIHPEA
jgi:REP element-mobilizing transposase RayT